MLYTTGQLRNAFQLSKQQWRSYRDALPPLGKAKGRASCFSTADLLAVSVARQISQTLSIPLSALTAVAEPLFEVCGSTPWPQLERSSLLIDLEHQRIVVVEYDHTDLLLSIAILVSLAPLVTELREHLLADAADPQRDLAFPPMIARGRR